MYVRQRQNKEHLKCDSCHEWKSDRFCDWELYLAIETLVVCSKCGFREATILEKKLIKVHNPKVVYTKTKLGSKNDFKHNKSNRRNKQRAMF